MSEMGNCGSLGTILLEDVLDFLELRGAKLIEHDAEDCFCKLLLFVPAWWNGLESMVRVCAAGWAEALKAGECERELYYSAAAREA